MDTIATVLILLCAVVASGAVARMLPLAIPLPLVQIAFGALLAAVADLGVTLNPDIFFLLLLPPLLFLDGWRIPKAGLFRDIDTILEMALGLVVFTVLGAGYLIHWLIPSIPLAAAFALAAIVSPTDPVAVSAIAQKVKVPRRMMHILDGESLLNDASGLVCMRFAVAALISGSFSLVEAGQTFLWLAVAGVGIGAGVTWLGMTASTALARRFGEDTGLQILFNLLIPFAAYLLAEKAEASGILAAVAAGLTMSYIEQRGRALAITRIRRNAVWDMVQFSLNGIVFTVLGEQLPEIATKAAKVVTEAGHRDPLWLIVYVLALMAGLMALRFVWVWVSLRISVFRAKRAGTEAQPMGWKIVAAMTVAGARGAITLAGILSLPLMLNGSTAFPARDLMIFLAACVIILSLIVASVALPILLRDAEMPDEPFHQRQEDAARAVAAKAAIRAVETAQHDLAEKNGNPELYTHAAARIIDLFRERVEGYSAKEAVELERHRQSQEAEAELWLIALRAEREEIYREARARRVSDDTARRLVSEIDLVEARLSKG